MPQIEAKINRKGVHVSEVEDNAALEEDQFIIDGGDQTDDETSDDSQQSDSATDTEETEVIEQETNTEDTTEKPESKGFQERINKVTAKAYDEKRRADALQKKLDELEAAKPKEELKKPVLEDMDYDEDAYNKANLDYEVKKGVQYALESRKAAELELRQKEDAETVDKAFKERIATLGKPDFDAKMNAIPRLPNGVAQAIMESDLSAEMVYHLGSHLDVADNIASMPAGKALMELGKLSLQLSAKQPVKTSAAPEPIEPIKTGASITKERGPVGATYE